MDLNEFKTWLSIHVGKKTTSNYLKVMESFFRQYSEFNQDNLNKYLSSKIDVWCPAMFNLFFAGVKKYCQFSKVTVELPKAKRVERKARPYVQEVNINEIIEKLPVLFNDYQKVKCVFSLLFLSGMRPKELYTLKRKNIKLDEHKIVLENTKTHNSRTIFITPEVEQDISTFFSREQEQDNAFNLGETTIQYYCQKITKHFNIKLTPYMLRHSFSHAFLKRTNNNLVALSKMLGHTSIKTTQIYSDIDEKELQTIFNKAFKRR
jgi:site-specific recombinase XerD